MPTAPTSRAQRAPELLARRSQQSPRDSTPRGSSRARRYWLGGHAPDEERRGVPRAGHRRRARRGRDSNRHGPKALLDGRQHGRARRIVGLRHGLKYRGRSRANSKPCCSSIPAFMNGIGRSRARALVFQSAAASSAAATRRAEEHLRDVADVRRRTARSRTSSSPRCCSTDEPAPPRRALRAADRVIRRAPAIECARLRRPEDEELQAQGAPQLRAQDAATSSATRSDRTRGRTFDRAVRRAPCASGAAAARTPARETRRT